MMGQLSSEDIARNVKIWWLKNCCLQLEGRLNEWSAAEFIVFARQLIDWSMLINRLNVELESPRMYAAFKYLRALYLVQFNISIMRNSAGQNGM